MFHPDILAQYQYARHSQQMMSIDACTDVAQFNGLQVATLAQFLIASHEEGKDMPAIAAWYDQGNWAKDNPTEQEERQYVWGLLKPYSKLRASIKANNPHKEAA
jgi:hypothetical protein